MNSRRRHIQRFLILKMYGIWFVYLRIKSKIIGNDMCFV